MLWPEYLYRTRFIKLLAIGKCDLNTEVLSVNDCSGTERSGNVKYPGTRTKGCRVLVRVSVMQDCCYLLLR